jgi:hypothetical protein
MKSSLQYNDSDIREVHVQRENGTCTKHRLVYHLWKEQILQLTVGPVLKQDRQTSNTSYSCKSRRDYIREGDHASHESCGQQTYEEQNAEIRLGKTKIIILAVTERRDFRVY